MMITLTTDFGRRDGYVGAMKGVIYSLMPRAVVVDITHEVPPFDVRHAAFVLGQAAPFFPPDTIHVAVVDPGVGGERRGMVAVHRRQFFVGPDNGIFTPFLTDPPVAWELKNPDLFLPHAAATFHGRDLFAPAAAHLAGGLPAAEVGPPLLDPVRLPSWEVTRAGDALRAAIIHIDAFGNCVTGLPAARLGELGSGPYRVEGAGPEALELRRTYTEVECGRPLALIGSSGLVEIAVREGNAAKLLHLQRDDIVCIMR